MLLIKTKKVHKNKYYLHPSEIMAVVETINGIEEVITHHTHVDENNNFQVAGIVKDEDRVLVEFPRESCKGAWRAWISEKNVIKTGQTVINSRVVL